MSEFNIINNCSPTLAGLKTGNIFNYEIKEGEDIYAIVQSFNSIFLQKGLKMIVLRVKDRVAMLYLYRPTQLWRDINRSEAKGLLDDMGYPSSNMDGCIEELARRVNIKGEFPHEIGLFIGYPIEDVVGFMEKGADGSKYCGAWRVYGDVDKAKKIFALYRKCRKVYTNAYTKNNNFEKLIISK